MALARKRRRSMATRAPVSSVIKSEGEARPKPDEPPLRGSRRHQSARR
jgi:hypothetical protein